MSYWSDLKLRLASRVSELSGATVTPEDFVLPPKPEMGDMAVGCFKLAKAMGKNPAEVAKTLAGSFGSADGVTAKAEGPFLNFILDPSVFIAGVVEDVDSAGAFGASTEGKGKMVMVEYAQPNTHKEMHVGHLRNLVLGASLVRILRHAGWSVIPASYHGDVGAHVAKCLYRIVAKADRSPADLKEKDVDAILAGLPIEQHNGEYLGRMYTEATREIGEDVMMSPVQNAPGDPSWKSEFDRKAEHRQAIKQAVSLVQQALESHHPAWEKLWLATRQWSLDEMAMLFKELDVNIDRPYLESEVVDEGQKIVDGLIKKGVAKESQGAIVVDLEEKKLGIFLIRKSDGTSLYATKDLALAYLKQKEYPKLDRSILLVDNRQSLYFQQLFETLKQMGYRVPLEHVGYEFVTLKSGAMSSREGNIVTYQEFRDEVVAKTRTETKKRHEDWSDEQVNGMAWAIAKSGIMFGMLRQDSEKIFTFDIDQALSFEGDTGPYVQYAAVRLGSILKKAEQGTTPADLDGDASSHPAEKALALALARYEDVCVRAARELRPGIIAQWCVETAHLSNAFYRDVPVLTVPEPVRSSRLGLVRAAHDVLSQGLGMLGIPVPDEM